MTRPTSLPVRALRVLVAMQLFCLMLTVAIDVGGRYLFASPLPAGYEMIQVQMGALAFTALPLLCLTNEHLSLGLFDHLFRGAVQRIRLFVIHGVSAAATGFLAWRIWVHAGKLGAMDETTPVLNFPYAPLGYLMATAAMVGALMLGALAVRSLFASRVEPGRS
jgi:TRAP-type C4-dicarboxylate transport system permease small subunit